MSCQLQATEVEGGFTGVGQGEGAREGPAVETDGTEVGVVVGAGSRVAAGDGHRVAAQGDLGGWQINTQLNDWRVRGVACSRGGLPLTEQTFKPAILAGQGLDIGRVAATTAGVAQGDEQVAALIHEGRVEAEYRAEGIGIASAGVGFCWNGQGAAASCHGIRTDIVGEGGAQSAGWTGGGAELNAVVAPVARGWGPGGLADVQAKGEAVNF